MLSKNSKILLFTWHLLSSLAIGIVLGISAYQSVAALLPTIGVAVVPGVIAALFLGIPTCLMFFRAFAEKYPNGELIFDCISNLAIKVAHKRGKKAGAKTPFWYIGIGDPIKRLAKWSNKIEVIDWYTMFARTDLNPRWHKKTLKMIKIAERFKTAKIVHVKFAS